MRYVITGGSRGLGKALAREVIANGDDVVLTSRCGMKARQVSNELKREAKMIPGYKSGGKAYGVECDISDIASIQQLNKYVDTCMNGADIWICNAGYSGGYDLLLNQEDGTIKNIVDTNLYGTIACAKNAILEEGSMLIFIDGAGANGIATPGYTCYGATKAGIVQFWKSIQEELNEKGVYCHMLSPGMILTPLLLDGIQKKEYSQILNILCEHPEVCAANLICKIREIVGIQENRYIKYLKLKDIIYRFVMYPVRKNCYFDEDSGKQLYSEHFDIRIKETYNDIHWEKSSMMKRLMFLVGLNSNL